MTTKESKWRQMYDAVVKLGIKTFSPISGQLKIRTIPKLQTIPYPSTLTEINYFYKVTFNDLDDFFEPCLSQYIPKASASKKLSIIDQLEILFPKTTTFKSVQLSQEYFPN